MSHEINDKRIGIKLATGIIFVASFVVRMIYILNTSVYERSHDVGCFTAYNDGQINPGHLGYIEYIVKFGKLPQINPFDLFSYYHPPLHHILASWVVKLSLLCKVSYEQAFENIQFLIVLYSMICIYLVYIIVKKVTDISGLQLLGVGIFAFHPAMIYMSGYVNNDMLTLLFELLCILFTVDYIKEKCAKYLYLMALSLGLGMCVKISVVIMAFPMGIVLLCFLIDNIKNARVLKLIGEYVIFGAISVSLGLSWTIRNLIKFHQKPGIASATPEDIKYMGATPVLDRILWPKNWGINYPFHNQYGTESTNAWLIMFRTALFGEMRPDVSGLWLILLRVLFIITVAFGLMLVIITTVILIRQVTNAIKSHTLLTDGVMPLFFISGYVAVIISYVAFVIKYPYTCSCDFRYVIVLLFYQALTFGMLGASKKNI